MAIFELNPSIHSVNYELCTLIAADLSTSIYSFLFSRIVTAGALSTGNAVIPSPRLRGLLLLALDQ